MSAMAGIRILVAAVAVWVALCNAAPSEYGQVTYAPSTKPISVESTSAAPMTMARSTPVSYNEANGSAPQSVPAEDTAATPGPGATMTAGSYNGMSTENSTAMASSGGSNSCAAEDAPCKTSADCCELSKFVCTPVPWVGNAEMRCLEKPPVCYNAGQRCAGAAGYKYVPFARCCDTGLDCKPDAARGWGYFCVKAKPTGSVPYGYTGADMSPQQDAPVYAPMAAAAGATPAPSSPAVSGPAVSGPVATTTAPEMPTMSAGYTPTANDTGAAGRSSRAERSD
jgi:hypothetical protein